jgi:1,2-diacylglycerol 3-alpha-glucosyltransferase
MRIAIFTNNYLPNPYGITQSIESFRHQYELAGHTVYIFAPRAKGYVDENPNACPTENFSKKNFGRVYRYPSVDLKYKISFPLAIPYSLKVCKILKNLKLDLIHSQHPNLLGTAAKKWAKRKNIPLVFTWHTLYDQYVHFAPLIPKKLAAWWVIKNAVNYANNADYVIAPTESAKRVVQDWGVTNKNIVAIPSGVDEKNFLDADRNLVRKKYNITDDEILLISVCRLTKEKNIEFLFHCAIKILEAFKNSKFMVVSDGDLIAEMKKLVEGKGLGNRVIFAGVIPRKEIKNYYAAGDIFIYSSKSETQGMILTEAMYMGLPVVVVKATGTQDLVEDGKSGFLVAENRDEFGNASEKLIGDKNLREKFGKESARIAREKYTDKVCAQMLLEVYNSLIKSK